eukprot:scaffold48_cov394-Pavlova_lutheri.AAC.2
MHIDDGSLVHVRRSGVRCVEVDFETKARSTLRSPRSNGKHANVGALGGGSVTSTGCLVTGSIARSDETRASKGCGWGA